MALENSEDIIEYLKTLGADKIPHSKTNLLDHCMNVADMLRDHGRPVEEQLAGLFHSIYGNEFQTYKINVSREDVRNVIGERSEYLVNLFCTLNDRVNTILHGTGLEEADRTSLRWIEYCNIKEQDPTSDILDAFENLTIRTGNRINCQELFPTPLWWTDLNLDNGKLLEECYQIKSKYSEGRTLSTRDGYQSHDLTSELSDLTTEIVRVANTIYKNNIHYPNDDRELYIENYWLNINPNRGHHVRHVHGGSFLSGVYYVSCVSDNDQGCIEFYQPEQLDFILSLYHPEIAWGETFKPVQGRMLIFPSYLPHSVKPNLLGNDRVAVSFNLGIE